MFKKKWTSYLPLCFVLIGRIWFKNMALREQEGKQQQLWRVQIPYFFAIGVLFSGISLLSHYTGYSTTSTTSSDWSFFLTNLMLLCSVIRILPCLFVENSMLFGIKKLLRVIEKTENLEGNLFKKISTEIVTPIVGINTFMASLYSHSRRKCDEKLMKELMCSVDNISQTAMQIVSSHQFFSGKVVVEKTTGNCTVIAEEIVNHQKRFRLKDGVSVSVHVNTSVPHVCEFDKGKLREMLTIIVSNAMKYTSRGKIKLSLNYSKSKELLEISIVDTGVGISAKDVERMLSPRFWNFEKTNEASFQLGLRLCKMYCETLGGKFVINSVVGRGTRLFLHIKAHKPVFLNHLMSPIKRRNRFFNTSSSSPAGLGRRSSLVHVDGTSLPSSQFAERFRISSILCLDNNEIQRQLLNEWMSNMGFKDVTICGNAVEAFKSFKEHSPSVVFVDYKLHSSTGVEFIEKCRKLEEQKREETTRFLLSMQRFEAVDLEISNQLQLLDVIYKPYCKNDVCCSLAKMKVSCSLKTS